jgi:multidrug efflux pump
VVGGLLIATFLTLYIVPGIYLLISSESNNTNNDDVSIEKVEDSVSNK